MKVFVVYCHPSEKSFTYSVYESFIRGLKSVGHEVVVSDLYKMNFQTDLTEEEYLRETYYRADIPVAEEGSGQSAGHCVCRKINGIAGSRRRNNGDGNGDVGSRVLGKF